MPLAIAYPPAAALNARQDAAAAAIRAVAAQVRRQIPREPDSLALTLPALIGACRVVEVNGQRLAVSWELGRALRDELGQTVLGLCDVDPKTRRFGKVLASALDRLRLCSGDPVCADHEPAAATDDRALHGAACHGCLLVAETSCEARNLFLDRALLVETVGTADSAFFG